MGKRTKAVVRTLLCASLGMVIGTGAAVAADAGPLLPKQLAGPATEFAAMRAPDPADAAILSRSALLPVAFDASGRAELRVPVHQGRLEAMLLSGGADWSPRLLSPAGVELPRATLARHAQDARLGGEHDGQGGTVLRLDGLVRGDWTLRLQAQPGGERRGYLLLKGDDALELASHQAHRRQLVGERMDIVAMLAADDGSAVALGRDAGHIRSAQLRIVAPDGRESLQPMFDDGRHGDGAAGDGRLAGGFVPGAAGTWIAQVIVHGHDRSGTPFVRTAEHALPVIAAGPRLATAAATASYAAPGRLAVRLPLADAKPGSHYRVLAEVWGRDGRGGEVPVAWIGGMAEAGPDGLSLGLDERWIARSGAGAPFELRALRIEDPDHFIPLATAARLPLSTPRLRLQRSGMSTAIDELMTMGPRPASPDARATATGRKLVLVHGYCSGGVWPQAQFANSATFLDANQNRSHDQFAQRIKTFGAQWNSFGTVAHSQGGAASLHLYAYYWSGLDNAAGSRLMQSVGTPYQGTNLSGILATVGNWFGVACGSNSNMTYSGASAWLAGIPTSARAKVNYYTTAFRTTNWYTNDYCNAASDLVLGDPEDGTVERAYAQLPGATNRGHTAGQCHTAGMRDPAQYRDAARNATMSANAAR
ncbi:choice-of-anchor X domain-containing protein [Luteimonas sp. MC1750]|uniref:choice-of-anchor X domain-containing protein n=1 Tax=Luteimonas sp. MC1750 TaxID=2799326 RepID=UPI0018F073CD|nr:choice-of-anchor X domain-containing protein [Luteimonas sp. MC1750]MBJ6985213.1 conditioned medium factor [Luteimonas sp. MC1750]QQO05861.1 conditioned medium factor [Luteimonas sp. MC1750]